MTIRTAIPADRDKVLALYRDVAAIPGGLARLADEITDDYINHFMTCAAERGLQYVAVDATGRVVGEIHAYSPGQFCFAHVLSDLTVAVHPDHQGQGVGRQLFTRLLDQVSDEWSHILRIELIARQSNAGAICFYRSLGFEVEGELHERIRNLDGTYESDIPMAWTRRD